MLFRRENVNADILGRYCSCLTRALKMEGTNVRSRKALGSGQICGDEGLMLSLTLSHSLAKDRPGDIYLRPTNQTLPKPNTPEAKHSRNQTNSKETNASDKTHLQLSITLL